jgi:hypothetical protein
MKPNLNEDDSESSSTDEEEYTMKKYVPEKKRTCIEVLKSVDVLLYGKIRANLIKKLQIFGNNNLKYSE